MGRALGHVLLAQRTIFADDGHRGTARCLPGIVPYPGDVILRPLLNQPDPFQHVGDVIYATLLHLQLLGGGVQIEGTIGSLGLETGARFVVRDPVRRGPLEQVNELFRQQPEGGVESTVRGHEAGRKDGDAAGACAVAAISERWRGSLPAGQRGSETGVNSGRRGLESRVPGLDELRAGVGVRYIIGGGR